MRRRSPPGGRDEGRTFQGKQNTGSLLRNQPRRHGIDLHSSDWKPSIAPQREGIMKQPNPLDLAVQSYQGGAFVTLDFTPEGERPKAARSNCPTTT
ncbi:hypothetical protein GWG65_20115 [Bradyrhizobium sp. CSA207]|uniref:hypothetical protein n=1 Tax=Bradyrhizobium sp. CSA207 TaxID=2698826 RepID=UPI0023B1FD1A|nr:hypothetical protein [Bradyrhizobium sp. CSA207]MDE5443710.1 hypothetical protein [Bradyrhizobium sp. CSA207]